MKIFFEILVFEYIYVYRYTILKSDVFKFRLIFYFLVLAVGMENE